MGLIRAVSGRFYGLRLFFFFSPAREMAWGWGARAGGNPEVRCRGAVSGGTRASVLQRAKRKSKKRKKKSTMFCLVPLRGEGGGRRNSLQTHARPLREWERAPLQDLGEKSAFSLALSRGRRGGCSAPPPRFTLCLLDSQPPPGNKKPERYLLFRSGTGHFRSSCPVFG